MTLLLTGTNVKFINATNGHTFQLLIINGIVSLSTSLETAVAFLPLNAAIAATKAIVFAKHPRVWSNRNLRNVLGMSSRFS